MEIRTGCGALELEDDGGLPVVHCDGNRETFDAVVVGIGVDLNLELARDAGLKTGRGIVVDARGTHLGSVHLCRRRCRPAPSLRLVHPVLGPSPRIRRWRRRKRCSIPMRRGYDDAPWLWSDQYQHNIQILGIPQAGCRTILREEALYFSLDDNGRLTQLVAFNDARTVKLAKRWMAAGRDLSDVPLADPTFSLMSLR